MNTPLTSSKKNKESTQGETAATDNKVFVAALGDIHSRKDKRGQFKELFADISKHADFLLLCGDLTDNGLIEEAKNLADDLSALTIPVLGVLGNHDYENNLNLEIEKILSSAGLKFLEKNPVSIEGIGFAGAKGFGGGFSPYILGSFGEPAIKAFVREAVNDSLHLENSLRMLENKKKVVVLHYSPIAQTLEGEPKEIYPFLGNSRLESVLNEFADVTAIFHGHAHHGKFEGFTSTGLRVYNCSYPICRKLYEQKKLNQPYALIEI